VVPAALALVVLTTFAPAVLVERAILEVVVSVKFHQDRA
jgi:hypothetical protein